MITVETLGRLIAASEDLTDYGMMNLQKLLEALVFAIVRVEARAHRRIYSMLSPTPVAGQPIHGKSSRCSWRIERP